MFTFNKGHWFLIMDFSAFIICWPVSSAFGSQTALFHAQDTSNYTTAQLLVLKDRPIPCVYQHSRGSRFDTIRDKTNYSSTFRTWRRMRDGVLQTLEIQSLPNPEGCFGISPCFADIYRCKATENFNFFLQKYLKMFWHWLPPNRA